MRHSKLTLVLACAVLLACTDSLSLRELRVEEQAVEAQLSTWVRSINNREHDSVAAMYHQVPELTVVWPDGHISRGWEEEQLAQTELFNSIERINFVKQSPQIEILSPKVALTTFRHSWDVVHLGGRPDTPRAGSVTVVWVKDTMDNMWKIHTEHISLVPLSEN